MDMITFAMLNGLKKSGGVGYEETKPGIDIKWDGNTDGRDCVYMEAEGVTAAFCKVSDKVFTVEELIGASVVNMSGHRVLLTEEMVFEPSAVGLEIDGGAIVMTGSNDVFSVKACSLEMDGITVTFPSDGTYFFGVPGVAHTSELTKDGEKTIHPIDPKFLLGKKKIYLSEYGIIPETLVMAGGGKEVYTDLGTFWTDISADDVVFSTNSHFGYEITPTTKTGSEIYFRLVVNYGGSVIDALLSIIHDGSNGATMYAVVNMTDLPT